MTTNEINYLSKSLAASVAFSKNNHRAEVFIAQRGNFSALSAVVRSIYGNRREPHYEVGYCRMGRKTVWLETRVIHNPHLDFMVTHRPEFAGLTVGEASVREIAAYCFRAADEVTALRSSA
jgi:hypothetical protein